MPGKETIRRVDPTEGRMNHIGCKHGGSGMGGEEHAYRRRRIWILDNIQGVSRGKPFGRMLSMS